jgi:hypothetical protein
MPARDLRELASFATRAAAKSASPRETSSTMVGLLVGSEQQAPATPRDGVARDRRFEVKARLHARADSRPGIGAGEFTGKG